MRDGSLLAPKARNAGKLGRTGKTAGKTTDRLRKSARLRVFGMAVAVALGGTVGLFAGTARASHYAVGDVPAIITADDAAKLTKAGVGTTEDLLQKAATPKDRKALTKASGLKATVVMDLARRCDLLRVKGVGPEMVLLLEASGVKTVADLAKKEAAALTSAADTANKAKKITEKPPTEPQFQDWIDQAKKLPPVIEGK
jgi:predicted flap endonuclease-1-like 5' DNA nuclease